MKCKRLFLMVLFLASSLAMAKNQLFYFEPKSVALTGIVKKLIFPGPPNYENIKKGDIVERGVYLILKNPIDVAVPPHTEAIGNDAFTENVSIIQLAVQKDQDREKLKEGNYVHVKGKLFRALFGHHHARILIDAEAVDVLPKKKITLKAIAVTEEDYMFMINNIEEPTLPLKIRPHD